MVHQDISKTTFQISHMFKLRGFYMNYDSCIWWNSVNDIGENIVSYKNVYHNYVKK